MFFIISFNLLNVFQATKAYEDLMIIIKHSQFRSQDAMDNIRRLRAERVKLPLSIVKSHPIHIDDQKTPSTSKPVKLAYMISIKEHLGHILNNPWMMEKMYFG